MSKHRIGARLARIAWISRQAVWLCMLVMPCVLASTVRDEAGLARRSGDYVLAEQLFRQAWQAAPQQADLSLDVAVVLIDQKKFPVARQHLQQHLDQFGESEAFWMTRGYLHDQQGEFFNSLSSYDNALRLNSHSADARRNRIHTVDSLGMPDKALDIAQAYPEVMRDQDWLRLRLDSAAYAVRMAGLDEDNRGLRERRVQTAIRRCDEAVRLIVDKFPDRQSALQQVRMDRLLVWGLDNWHQGVVDEYAALQAEGVVWRDDTRVAIAQSALHLEHPELALALLEPMAARHTRDINARILLFYAYIESEQYDKAQHTVDTLVKDEPVWRYGQSPTVVGKNWNRVSADNDNLLLAAWGNDLDAAQQGMEAYQGKAPFNVHLRGALADIYGLRGWPRHALDQYTQTLQQAPDLYSARHGIAGAHMDLYDFPVVEKISQDLVREYPHLKSTESLQEDWAVHNMQELTATFSLGHSDPVDESDDNDRGGANGSQDFTADVWWFSRPLDYRNRAFFHTSSATGTFDEGKGQIDRYGVGWERRERVKDWTFRHTAEINRSYASDADMGLTLASDWQITDHWSVNGAVETFSSQLPVRAYNDGVTAHSLDMGARYQVNEGEYYRGGMTYMDFSDGNQRWMVNGAGYQVVYAQPHHQWALVETVYASTNTKSDVIYFSPERDTEVGLAVEYQGILKRHYDFSFRHRLLMGMGLYNQQGYGTDPTAQLDYRHNWQRDKQLAWFYGVALNLHPYDGDQELHEALYGGFTWRFD
jgi:biofilm PGA synthesis protein PgaA